MNTNEYILQWREKYFNDITSNIMPFWLKYGLDRINGGIYTCIDRKGNLMDSTKSVWFQGRFAYIAAYTYNNIEKNTEWLAASKSTIDFIEKYCFDKDGRMFFEVTADGKPLRKRRYVFSEAFAAIAMAEYSIASGNKTYAEKALELFKNILSFIETPGILAPKYTDNLQCKGHSITMILINTANCIKAAINDDALDLQIEKSIASIKNDFMHSEYKALLETVGPNGEFIDTCMGRTINPGHCIETAWFILEEAKNRNWDKTLVDMATTILDWSWSWGWDSKYGGISNFKDCKGYPSQDYAHDMKFWWPQTEAIIATLYAYLATGNKKYLDMHKQISDYTYSHFPDKEYGEWYGYLHFDGSVSQDAKGNLFKGPFHIPRMMVKSHILCKQILEKDVANKD
ncbi:N-acylglucosamine 2-epimerase [Dysgonomonadaceae bacterium PH5-43]|nr:N-acylglucosamine 2-epimerase [Dysgonomonadaceae bacterium PH5-43]